MRTFLVIIRLPLTLPVWLGWALFVTFCIGKEGLEEVEHNWNYWVLLK